MNQGFLVKTPLRFYVGGFYIGVAKLVDADTGCLLLTSKRGWMTNNCEGSNPSPDTTIHKQGNGQKKKGNQGACELQRLM